MTCGFHSKPELWRDSGYSRSYPNMEYSFAQVKCPICRSHSWQKFPVPMGFRGSLSGISPIMPFTKWPRNRYTYHSVGPSRPTQYYGTYLPITTHKTVCALPVLLANTPTVNMVATLFRLVTIATTTAVVLGHAVLEVPTPRRVSVTSGVVRHKRCGLGRLSINNTGSTHRPVPPIQNAAAVSTRSSWRRVSTSPIVLQVAAQSVQAASHASE
jgi:hypothetical protein